MLDHHHAVAALHEAAQRAVEQRDVREVQPGGGLVEEQQAAPRAAALASGAASLRREGASAGRLAQVGGELEPLRLARRERGGGLPEPQVAEPGLLEQAQLAHQAALVGELDHRLLHGQLQRLGEVAPAHRHRQHVGPEAVTLAALADHLERAEELQVHLLRAGAAAVRAAAEVEVEREVPRRQPQRRRLRRAGEEPAQLVVRADGGDRVGARGAPQRPLVHHQHLGHHLEPAQLAAGAGLGVGLAAARPRPLVEHALDQGRLARAGDAGDRHQRAERQAHVDAAQVVRRGAEDLQRGRAGLGAARHHPALLPPPRRVAAGELRAAAPQVPRGERIGTRQQLVRRALEDDAPAAVPGPGPQLHEVVGAADHRRVVLDHHHRVAARREVAQQAEEPPAVAGVQPHRRLVERVERAGEARAERGGELDALRLATRQRAPGAVEGEVVETDAVQHLEPVRERLEQVLAAGPLGRAPRLPAQPAAQLLHREAEQLGQVAPAQAHAQRVGLQARAAAVGAGVVAAVAGEQHAHVHLVGAPLEPLEELVEAAPAPFATPPDPLPRLLGELAPGHVERHAAPPAGLEQRRVVLLVRGRVPRRERALAQRLAGIGDDPLAVDADDAAEAAAGRAGAERRVEGEQRRGRAPRLQAADGAGKLLGEPQHAPVFAVDEDAAARQTEGLLHHLGEPRLRLRTGTEAAEQQRQRIELGRPRGAGLQPHDPIVRRRVGGGAEHPEVALPHELLQLVVGALAGPRHGRHQQHVLARRAGGERGGGLLGRPGAGRAVPAGAADLAEVGEEQPQQVVGLGESAHRGARVAHRVAGLERHRRQQALHALHRRPLELLDELLRVGRHRLDEAPLPFGEQGVEDERGLARAGGPRDHRHVAVRDGARDPLQVVRARSVEAQEAAGGGRGHGGAARAPPPGGGGWSRGRALRLGRGTPGAAANRKF